VAGGWVTPVLPLPDVTVVGIGSIVLFGTPGGTVSGGAVGGAVTTTVTGGTMVD
jgi:hypothetical protein